MMATRKPFHLLQCLLKVFFCRFCKQTNGGIFPTHYNIFCPLPSIDSFLERRTDPTDGLPQFTNICFSKWLSKYCNLSCCWPNITIYHIQQRCFPRTI